MLTAWRDAAGCRLEHFEQLRVIVLAVAARAPEAHPLPRQRSRDEGGLAEVHHALARRGES
jgi:hypothetical protein